MFGMSQKGLIMMERWQEAIRRYLGSLGTQILGSSVQLAEPRQNVLVFLSKLFLWHPVFPLWFGNLVLRVVWLYLILTLQFTMSSPYDPQVFYFLFMVIGSFEAKCKGHHGFLGFP